MMIAGIGYVYPMYESVKALRTPGLDDDKYWLTYWIVYGFFSAIDSQLALILKYIPCYQVLKLLFIIFLINPTMQGKQIIYERLIEPIANAYEKNKESRSRH